MVVIIDYGMGNSGSILNMLKKCSVQAMISSRVRDIEMADKLILPGVGAFDSGMMNLDNSELRFALDKKVFNSNTPILGICLGMQLFTKKKRRGFIKGVGLDKR